jgi:hypothetical protein
MANPEHLQILKQGVEVWNQWREQHKDIRPDLTGAALHSAHLSKADFTSAALSGAALSRAHLSSADFTGADLSHADLNRVKIGWATFAHVDLRTVQGLDTVVHEGPSSIGIDTLYRSYDNIPEVFLRGGWRSRGFHHLHEITGRSTFPVLLLLYQLLQSG